MERAVIHRDENAGDHGNRSSAVTVDADALRKLRLAFAGAAMVGGTPILFRGPLIGEHNDAP